MKNTARNSQAMKLGNMLEIIDIVRRGPVSRAEIARAMGLTRAAVTIIVDRLAREGVIVERPRGGEGGGGKPVLLDVDGKSLCFLGIDITRVNCTIGIVDVKGGVVARTGFDLCPDDPFDAVLPDILAGARGLIAKLDNPAALQGAGVSAPGPVDARSGVALNPPNFRMLQGEPVVEKLRRGLGCDLFLDNNAIARTLYEKNLGKGRPFRNFIVMTVDTGIGSGLILDGRLYRGAGFAGEAGHASIHMGGDLCGCGNKGCLEGYASVPALLCRECAGYKGIASWKDVMDKVAEGDAHCLEVVRKEARYLAQGILNIANLLDIEAVILSGFIAYHPGPLLEEIRRYVRGGRITEGVHALEILASGVQEDAGVLCAAMIAMERFFNGDTGWRLQT